jgi:hypothetical protein
VKVTICIPRLRQVEGRFATCLANLVAASVGGGIGVKAIDFSDSCLPLVRTVLVEKALAERPDAILFIDADQTFQPDALLRLVKRSKPVVGANYTRRSMPPMPTASRRRGDLYEPVHTTLAKGARDELEQVDALGLGFCLIGVGAFHVLRERERQGGEPFYPLFAVESAPGGREFVSEDTYFFNKLGRAGIEVWLDHGVSQGVGHLGERELMNSDAMGGADLRRAS